MDAFDAGLIILATLIVVAAIALAARRVAHMPQKTDEKEVEAYLGEAVGDPEMSQWAALPRSLERGVPKIVDQTAIPEPRRVELPPELPAEDQAPSGAAAEEEQAASAGQGGNPIGVTKASPGAVPEMPDSVPREPAAVLASEPIESLAPLPEQEPQDVGRPDGEAERAIEDAAPVRDDDREAPLPDTPHPEAVADSSFLTESPPSVPSKRKTPTIHRDRRGSRRARQGSRPSEPSPGTKPPDIKTAAEALLRLVLHPIQRSAQLSLVLTRPEGFPATVSVGIPDLVTVQAFDQSRYDDVDIDWQTKTLTGELRFESPEGYSWIRSARRLHIFSIDPAEAGVISVSAARLGAEHTVVCTVNDADLVSRIAESTGSPPLTPHDHWQGIPEGWCVLSGYIPKRAATEISEGSLRPLDPGYDLEISLIGGLAIRAGIFAEGHPPRIETGQLPEGVSISIDGQQARQGSDGGWEADGWYAPGLHLIDIVPGPSLSYEIMRDPAGNGGWQMWDAHAGRFEGNEPWARAQICGAALSGPLGETICPRNEADSHCVRFARLRYFAP